MLSSSTLTYLNQVLSRFSCDLFQAKEVALHASLQAAEPSASQELVIKLTLPFAFNDLFWVQAQVLAYTTEALALALEDSAPAANQLSTNSELPPQAQLQELAELFVNAWESCKQQLPADDEHEHTQATADSASSQVPAKAKKATEKDSAAQAELADLLEAIRNHTHLAKPQLRFSYPGLSFEFDFKVSARQQVAGTQPVKGVKNIIAVSSAKGGVGKSTVSTNLAYALAATGVKVGLLDADIYGPSIPHMLNAGHLQPTSPDQKTMDPLVLNGLQVNSIGFLVGETDPTIWRGPVASQMLTQLMQETNWDLDYLIIDMPPGTGDIQLTVAQKLPITAAVIVSTPQEVALLDVLKGFNMYQKLNVPVLGFVENMAWYDCVKCGHRQHIFAEAGVQEMAQVLQQRLLASIPLKLNYRRHLDDGAPTALVSPQGEGKVFLDLADAVAASLYHDVKTRAASISIKSL